MIFSVPSQTFLRLQVTVYFICCYFPSHHSHCIKGEREGLCPKKLKGGRRKLWSRSVPRPQKKKNLVNLKIQRTEMPLGFKIKESLVSCGTSTHSGTEHKQRWIWNALEYVEGWCVVPLILCSWKSRKQLDEHTCNPTTEEVEAGRS
jgi:hypothetical protein